MPGLYGLIARDSANPPAGFPPARHLWSRAARESYIAEPRLILGSYQRHRPPRAASFHQNDSRFAALYGHCLDPRTGRPLDASAFLDGLRDEGDTLLDRLEGAFHAVVADREQRRLRLIIDRIGIAHVYWYQDEDVFAFAPRIGLLPPAVRRGAPDPGAVINFLSVGHFLGPATQLAAVRFLTPATILEIDLDSLTLQERRYWNLVYTPDEATSPARLRDELGEAIVAATELMTQPESGRPGIFLSGGWDSRSLLGASLRLDRAPQLVVTNGKTDELPLTDTNLARRMATDLGLPYRFCRRVPDIGRAAWLDGLHKGELTTANNPENFGQHDLPPDYFDEIDYILKGDVTWGSGAPALDRRQSIAKIVPYPLMDNVKAVLNPDLRPRADKLYEAEIDSVVRHCENDGWTERRDYLWQMGGINRYILGLGISDEEHVQVRRPLLAGSVLAVYTRVPRRYRIHKNLFVESLSTFYPHLFKYGRAHVGNIAYYYAYMADWVRERTLAHLDAGHDVHGLLDRDACRAVIEAFRPREDPDRLLGWRTRLKYRFHDRYSHFWYRNQLYREKNVKQFKTTPTMLAFHIYLLLEWFHGFYEPPE
jgi:hypothetical protein